MLFQWKGLISYTDALVLQKQAVERAEPIVYGLEHSHVVTLGRRIKNIEDVMLVKELPSEFEVHRSERGGEATIHTPGQLVVYPVLPIEKLGIGIKDYVKLLEEVMIQTLQNFGIESFCEPDKPGIYTPTGKIGFIGIRVSHGFAYHGLSLNVNNDLALFDLIRVCSAIKPPLTSLKLLGSSAAPKEVFERLITHFLALFPLTIRGKLMESAGSVSL